jgi:tRNA 2-selenouridine synthase
VRAAEVVHLELPLDARVALLLEDYAHFVDDVESFCHRLVALRELRGAAVVERWQAMARTAELGRVVRELLTEHYDPVYLRSMLRNFPGFAAARPLTVANGSPAELAAAARALIATASPNT